MENDNSNTTEQTDVLLTARQVSEILKIGERRVPTLPITKISLGPKTLRYHREDVDAFIEQQRKYPTLALYDTKQIVDDQMVRSEKEAQL